jgi:hypothetical protein
MSSLKSPILIFPLQLQVQRLLVKGIKGLLGTGSVENSQSHILLPTCLYNKVNNKGIVLYLYSRNFYEDYSSHIHLHGCFFYV